MATLTRTSPSTSLWMGLVVVLVVGVATTVLAFQPFVSKGFRRRRWWRGGSADEDQKLGVFPSLPSTVVKYSQVPKQGTFTATNIPRGLLKDHTTKVGTWGVIVVSQGTLEYTITEPEILRQVLVAPATGVIEPQRLHHVKPLSDNAEFVVEFYRVPGTGPVNEKREGL